MKNLKWWGRTLNLGRQGTSRSPPPESGEFPDNVNSICRLRVRINKNSENKSHFSVNFEFIVLTRRNKEKKLL